MDYDVSKAIIAILLVMAIFISVLGTLSVVSTFERIDQNPRINENIENEVGSTSGSVGLSIVGDTDEEIGEGAVKLSIIR